MPLVGHKNHYMQLEIKQLLPEKINYFEFKFKISKKRILRKEFKT